MDPNLVNDPQTASPVRIGPGRLVGTLCVWGCLIAPAPAWQARSAPVPGATLPVPPPLPPPRPDRPAPPPPAPVAPPAPLPEGRSGGGQTPVAAGAPPNEATCLTSLQAMNVAAEAAAVGPQPDPRCIVADPVRLTGLRLADGTGVTFPDRPTIACTTATVFASFVRDLLVPLAKGTYGSALDAVWTGPGLECRTRDHVPGAKLSAHGEGLAVDIARLRLADKRVVEVGRPGTALDNGFEAAARAGGCGYFHTALGPGSDAFHETHWHFDLIPRGAKGESKLCQ